MLNNCFLLVWSSSHCLKTISSKDLLLFSWWVALVANSSACVTLKMSLNLCLLQFSQLSKRDNTSTYLSQLWWELNQIILVKRLVQVLAHRDGWQILNNAQRRNNTSYSLSLGPTAHAPHEMQNYLLAQMSTIVVEGFHGFQAGIMDYSRFAEDQLWFNMISHTTFYTIIVWLQDSEGHVRNHKISELEKTSENIKPNSSLNKNPP